MVGTENAFQELEAVERQMFLLMSSRPHRAMSEESERAEVRDIFVKSQGFDKIPVPEVRYTCVSSEEIFNCRVERLAGTSWENTACSAHLFLPLAEPPYPVVLCACGHGKDKLNYNRFGAVLARRGIACLVHDNMGQLERESMGHWEENTPFACGFSFIALLTSELLGVLDFLKRDSRFSRIGAAGNSGGGTLTMNLAALAPDYLEAIASTGYPSSFEWICRKRKRHCSCNLFPGVIGRIEHDELYSLFAPRPLLMMQGLLDNLIPLDVFRAMTGRVAECYRQMGASENFIADNWYGPHPWNREAMEKMADFFSERFGVNSAPCDNDELWKNEDPGVFGDVYDKFPEWALSTAQLACQLSGEKVPAEPVLLHDIWKCERNEEYAELYSGSDTRRILAQWRCFMNGFEK